MVKPSIKFAFVMFDLVFMKFRKIKRLNQEYTKNLISIKLKYFKT